MMKKKLLFISLPALIALAAINVNLAFNNDSIIHLSLTSIEALARGETLYCSVCGEQIDACRCGPAITCDKGDCHGKECHIDTFNLACPCDPTGDPFNICTLYN